MPNAALVDSLEPRRLFAALTAGVTATTSVSSAKPVKRWTIDLEAGQVVYVAAGTSGDSAFAPLLVLVRPDGKTLTRAAGRRGAIIGRTAPVSGTYTVRLQDNAAALRRGDVSVTAVFAGDTDITDSDDGRTVVSGLHYTGGIGPGDLDVWRIDATSGQYLEGSIIESIKNSPIGVGYAVIKPDRTLGESGESINDQYPSEASFEFGRQQRTQGGSYYVVVYEPTGHARGRYDFGAAVAPGTQPTDDPDTQQPLGTKGRRTGTLLLADYDVFRVDLKKGQTLTADARLTLYDTGVPYAQIISPDGHDISRDENGWQGGSGDDLVEYDISAVAATNGTYYVLVTGGNRTKGGQPYELDYSVFKA